MPEEGEFGGWCGKVFVKVLKGRIKILLPRHVIPPSNQFLSQLLLLGNSSLLHKNYNDLITFWFPRIAETDEGRFRFFLSLFWYF